MHTAQTDPNPPRGVLSWIRGFSPWLLVALALGLVRFWALGRWSLWYDEALTISDAVQGPGSSLHGLGYRWIGLGSRLWGEWPSEASIRWLPAVAGYLAIPIGYWAFLPWLGRQRAGWLSLLLALSSWQIAWSQTARGYTLAEVFCLLGFGLLCRAWKRPSGPLSLAALLVMGFSFRMHPHGVVLAGAAGLALLVFLWPRSRREEYVPALLWVGIGLLLGVIWQAPSMWAALQNYWMGASIGGVSSLVHLVRSTVFYVTPVVSIASLYGAAWIIWRRDREGLHLLATVFLVSLGIALAGAGGKVSAQYMFSSHAWIIALAVWPIGRSGQDGLRGAGLGGLLVITSLVQTGLYFSVREGDRPRWREAFEYVWDARQEHDLVLSMQAGLGDVYLDPGFTDVRKARTVGWTDRMNPQNFERVKAGVRPTWLIVRPAFLEAWSGERRRSFEAFLATECQLLQRYPLDLEGRNLDLEVFYRPGR